jgi:nucleotide-binding universal stress UspA family protein
MKVLLGIGGSDDSLRALERGVDRVAETDDDLTVAILRNPATEATPDEIEGRVESILAEAAVSASIRHLDGDPGSRLVELAEREGYDRIVLGGGERSPMGKIKLGSVSEYVLLNSQVSVTLVR